MPAMPAWFPDFPHHFEKQVYIFSILGVMAFVAAMVLLSLGVTNTRGNVHCTTTTILASMLASIEIS